MPYKKRPATCKWSECSAPYMMTHAKQKYCSKPCSTKAQHAMMADNPAYDELRARMVEHLRSLHIEQSTPEWAEKIGRSSNRRKRQDIPKSIFECSSRTRIKILTRLGVKCSYCGWDEDMCDLHHLEGRGGPDPHRHSNLTPLCPNHHRLIHKGKISRSDVKTLEELYGDTWVQHYYS